MSTSNEDILVKAKTIISRSSEEIIISIDKLEFDDAITQAYHILLELTHDDVTLDIYDEIYWLALQEITIFKHILLKLDKPTDFLSNLYDSIQMKYKALPRCYLLIVIGCLIISRDSSTLPDITSDLTYSCNAIHAPFKSLYLRRFLVESVLATVRDIAQNIHVVVVFLLDNFSAMNKVWVRVGYYESGQYSLIYRDSHSRLKLFMHFIINKLADMVEIRSETYSNIIFPFLLDEIVSCANKSSQESLLSLILTSFPENRNIPLFKLILEKCKKINIEFDYSFIVGELCNASTRYFSSLDNKPEISETINNLYNQLVEFYTHKKTEITTRKRLLIFSHILKLVLKFERNNITLLTDIFGQLQSIVSADFDTKSYYAELRDVFIKFILSEITLKTLLKIDTIFTLVRSLEKSDQIFIFASISTKVEKDESHIDTIKEFDRILTLSSIMIAPDTNEISTPCSRKNYEAFAIYILAFQPTDIAMHTYFTENTFQCMRNGGPLCIRAVMPTLVMYILKFTKTLLRPTTIDEHVKVFKFTFEIIGNLTRFQDAYIMIQLYLLCAIYLDDSDAPQLHLLTQAFVCEALTLFEESITSPDQLKSLFTFVGCLSKLRNMPYQTFTDYCVKIEKNASGFTSYSNQCHGVLHVTHLYWSNRTQYCDDDHLSHADESIMRCFNRASTIISGCIGESLKISLYTDLLLKIIYFYEEKLQNINSEYIESIFNKANEEIKNLKMTLEHQTVIDTFERVRTYYNSTTNNK